MLEIWNADTAFLLGGAEMFRLKCCISYSDYTQFDRVWYKNLLNLSMDFYWHLSNMTRIVRWPSWGSHMILTNHMILFCLVGNDINCRAGNLVVFTPRSVKIFMALQVATFSSFLLTKKVQEHTGWYVPLNGIVLFVLVHIGEQRDT